MEVLYHIRPYFMGIFPYIGLKNRPYRYLKMVGTSNESVPEMAIDTSSANHPTPKVTPKLSHPETESEVISCQKLVLNVHFTCSIVCEFHSMVTYDRGKKIL